MDNSWLMVMNSVNSAGANLMETVEECGVSSESSSEPGAQISLVETVMNGKRRVVVEGADNSGPSVVNTVNSQRGGVKCADNGGGVMGDHSSSHDLGGCSQGRRGEHRQGRHQETGLRYEGVRGKKEFFIAATRNKT